MRDYLINRLINLFDGQSLIVPKFFEPDSIALFININATRNDTSEGTELSIIM